MSDVQSVQRLLQRALAFAHAALDETTPFRVAESKRYAAQLWPRLKQLETRAFTLGEGRNVIDLCGQLRAVLEVLDRKLERQQPHDGGN